MIAIPLLKERVAPRCTFAESILVASLKYGRVTVQDNVPFEGNTSIDLVRTLNEQGIRTLICGGISESAREALVSSNVAIIENVTGTAEEILEALKFGKVKSGFGFNAIEDSVVDASSANDTPSGNGLEAQKRELSEEIDCLNCVDRKCLRGENCVGELASNLTKTSNEVQEMLESAMDVAFEEERKLCRMAELVYYCLGMKYERIGVAFCIELLHPSTILVGVLRRFFKVFPVCCKIGGVEIEDDNSKNLHGYTVKPTCHIACNPIMQAEMLNRFETDINIIVGLCVGADSIFTSASNAPVTTIFVKDKSLANNPIGAVYSDYYLNEI
ncbi:DUF1847 domain-containing protein [bacterium]|nr:DUF1847 domain-containing protein [bacterium]